MEKKNNALLVTTIILAILVASLGGYIVYDKLLKEEKTDVTEKKEKDVEELEKEDEEEVEVEEEKTDEQEQDADKDNCLQASTVKCFGTYYVNGDINQGVYHLNADGTYNVENKEESGVFTINENTITFIQMKHTTGPRDLDPIYTNPTSYLIADDCSKIWLTPPTNEITAALNKIN